MGKYKLNPHTGQMVHTEGLNTKDTKTLECLDVNSNDELKVVSNKMEVDGYTKLGDHSSSPAIKTKVLTGRTSSTSSSTIFNSGIDGFKVVLAQCFLESSSGYLQPPNSGDTSYNYDFQLNRTNDTIYITRCTNQYTQDTPYRIFLMYKE